MVGARCIWYRTDDKSARQRSDREHYQLMISSPGVMDDEVECGPTGHGVDGVHKSIEDDVIVDTLQLVQHLVNVSHNRTGKQPFVILNVVLTPRSCAECPTRRRSRLA